MPRPSPTDEQLYLRFWSRVDKSGECWLWTGGRFTEGYGAFHMRGQAYAVHRLSYEMGHGSIPEGKQVHHKCEVKLCVRPDHLVALTLGDHNGVHPRAMATHCPRGHEYTPENSNWQGPNKQWRQCKLCLRLAGRRAYRRKRGLSPRPEDA